MASVIWHLEPGPAVCASRVFRHAVVIAAPWGRHYYPIPVLQVREQRQREVAFLKPFMATVHPDRMLPQGTASSAKPQTPLGFLVLFIVEYFNICKSKQKAIIKSHEFPLPSIINDQFLLILSLNYSEANPRHHVYIHFIFYFHKTEILQKTLTITPLDHLTFF